MIVLYLRSSSYNTFDNCQMQFYISYVLGRENPAGKAAHMGGAVHKVLECLAAQKLCVQESLSGFEDDALGHLNISDCDPDRLMDSSFDFHVRAFPDRPDTRPKKRWKYEEDLQICRDLLWRTLNFNNGSFDPRNRDVVAPEQKFDLVLPHDWAKFEYKLPDGREFSGQLSIKGTIDLVTRVRPHVYEIVDWKTGRRSDFATGEIKDFDKLSKDPQLLLYYYAAAQLWPDKEILMTIFFIKEEEGGPFTIPVGRENIPQIEEMIQKQFHKIQKTQKPALNPGPPWSTRPNYKDNWKCTYCCEFSKTSLENSNKTTCEFFRDEIKEHGMDFVTEKYADFDKIGVYGAGGGRGDTNKKEGKFDEPI